MKNDYNLEQLTLTCPYCGEKIDTLIEVSSETQEYYEDCSVCCSPILFSLKINGLNGDLLIEIKRDDE